MNERGREGETDGERWSVEREKERGIAGMRKTIRRGEQGEKKRKEKQEVENKGRKLRREKMG